MRRIKDEERSAKINKILESFSQIRAIKAIKSRRNMNLTIGMLDADGKMQTDKASVTEIFAKFYEELYHSRRTCADGRTAQSSGGVTAEIPSFKSEELEAGLRSIKSGRARDGKGFIAEMLKVDSSRLRSVLLQLMNAVLRPKSATPSEWHESVMKIIFKGGDATQAKNYRPICVMPLLYKLLAVMIQKRLTPTLERALSKEQAGFRKHYSTIDHLHTLVQVQQKTDEWQIPLWICFIDYEKAFDSIEHDAIWTALARQGVPDGYVELLARLYAGQSGRVSVDSTLSRSFVLGRGTKQGDPLSTLLFNAVLEDVFNDIRPKWEAKKHGLEMSLGRERHLTHLCFADDVALMAANGQPLSEMIADLKKAAAARGLKIHSGKTKILTNLAAVSMQRVPSSLAVDGETYAVLGATDSTKYLGRKVCCKDPHQVELDNRIAKAWGAFSQHKQELTDRRHRLANRMRLFEAVVTSTLLYGSETWTLRLDQQRRLRTVQRKMLRMVLNARRRTVAPGSSSDQDVEEEESEVDELETWQDFLERTAQWTDEQLQKANLCQWTESCRKKKWQWACKMVSEEDSKWSIVSTLWCPFLHSNHRCGRRQARPKKRWDQDIIDYLKEARPDDADQWHELAKDKSWWLSHTDDFASYDP